MARIKTGSIVSDISGKVGSEIYSRNKGGPYVKNWAAPTIPFSSFRDLARDALSDANTAWTNLSDGQKNAWSGFSNQFTRASFYDGYRIIDPRAHFISSFINQSYIGLSPNPLPVFPVSPGFTYVDLDLSASPSPLITPYGGSANANFKIIYSASFPVSAAVRSPNTVSFYNFGFTDYNPGAPYDFAGDYFTRFGVLPASPQQRVFLKARVIHTSSGNTVGSFITDDLFLGTLTPGILGINSVLGSTRSDTNNWTTRVQAAYDGFITGLNIYLQATGGEFNLSVYNTLSGQPNALLGSGYVASGYSVPGWVSAVIDPEIAIVQNNYYWLAINKSLGKTFRYVGSGNSSRFYSPGVLAPPNPWQLQSANSWSISLYANVLYLI